MATPKVALLAEGVDRNHRKPLLFRMVVVALLAEGVDRNLASSGMNDVDEVALLAEGVDRNSFKAMVEADRRRRPPRGGRG